MYFLYIYVDVESGLDLGNFSGGSSLDQRIFFNPLAFSRTLCMVFQWIPGGSTEF